MSSASDNLLLAVEKMANMQEYEKAEYASTLSISVLNALEDLGYSFETNSGHIVKVITSPETMWLTKEKRLAG